MKYDIILRLANTFHKYSEGYTLTEIVKNLRNIKSFTARLKYCVANFKKLGNGTSRIAFLLPDGKVLKLAKNAKGIAQNITESDWSIKSKIFNKVLAADDDSNHWLITNLAKKVTPSFFAAHAGVPIDVLGEVLRYWDHFEVKGNKPGSNPFIFKPKNYDEIKNNKFVKELMDVIRNYGLLIGDFWRLSSYGDVNGQLTVIDFGLTQDIYDTYYKK